MTRIALATCAHHPGFIANDDQPLLDAFARRGVEALQPRWDDDTVDWSTFDAVVIRTTWDYQDRVATYLEWIDAVNDCTVIMNSPAVVRANIRKTYLRDLEQAGIPIVTTKWVAPGELAASKLDGLEGDIIIKPCIGAGASGLLRTHTSAHDDINAHVATITDLGDVLIQPFIHSVHDRGELSIAVIGGAISHAVRKVPATGDFRVQIEFGGQYTVVEPTPREIDVATRAVEVLSPRDHPLTYARVDLIDLEPDQPAIGEVELIEPELFLPLVPAAAERFADVILATARDH